MRRALSMLALVGALAPACKSQDNTQIVVAVWSNMAVPSELDTVRIEVTGSAGTSSRDFFLTAGSEPGKTNLPALLELVPTGAKDATITVKATGMRTQAVVVSQTSRLSFIPGQKLLLSLFLARDCIAVLCPADYTCAYGGCNQPIAVTGLPPFVGIGVSPPDPGRGVDGGTIVDSATEAGATDSGSIEAASLDVGVDRAADSRIGIDGASVEVGDAFGLDASADAPNAVDAPVQVDLARGLDSPPSLDGADAAAPSGDGSVNPDLQGLADKCTSTGGTLGTQSCCAGSSDFRDTCTTAIGACGCAPASSRSVGICYCPSGACFQPSKGCVGSP